ncbi:MAG: glutamine-hydrolyzing carbamoyl-phosphate synthase small subunit [Bdellovibrionales bacterium]
MNQHDGFLVLESGKVFSGKWRGSAEGRAGEVVFNTGHSGYEEMATDPSYCHQILVMTAPQQGNYGASAKVWESRKIWIEGFICVEVQDSPRESSWLSTLKKAGVPVLEDVETRRLVLHLRERGTEWGALVQAQSQDEAVKKGLKIIQDKKSGLDLDWVHQVSRKSIEKIKGKKSNGIRIAVLDFGCKENTLRELAGRCEEVCVFPARSSAAEIKSYNPNGILLSNGPGDPLNVEAAAETVRELVGWRFIFGICMGHQVLARALGAKTYRLRFGHRGSNHPIQDRLLNKIYMTSQNHGYAVENDSLPKTVEVSHVNLNDNTVAGIHDPSLKLLSVQFHPESRPGPHDSVGLFDYFLRQIQ